MKDKGETMRFLENLDLFRGTGERNAAGQTLEEFLDRYDAKRYDCPSNTVDMLIFRSEEPYRRFGQPLKLLMVKRSNHPSIGAWAAPGGFVNLREDIADAAKRELEEETGVTGVPMVQLRTWGNADRDPRWRVITTAYLALVEGELPVKAGDDAADARWFDAKLELLSREEDGEKTTERWRLLLQGEPENCSGEKQGQCGTGRDVIPELCTELERTQIRRGILTETKYRMLANRGIANDHGLLIADALLYLREQTAGNDRSSSGI